jgi:hypothetical protein
VTEGGNDLNYGSVSKAVRDMFQTFGAEGKAGSGEPLVVLTLNSLLRQLKRLRFYTEKLGSRRRCQMMFGSGFQMSPPCLWPLTQRLSMRLWCLRLPPLRGSGKDRCPVA